MLNAGDILEEKYKVIKVLGKGGMGIVYLCENLQTGKLWAIKEVYQGINNIDVLSEVNILKDLNHIGIRRIIDVFYENKKLYMVQDYVEGQTLKEYVGLNSSMKIEEILNITLALCDIIRYLHNQNSPIIYRDIKPSNIIITPSDRVVLIDFGISKVYKSDAGYDKVYSFSNGYAAPEQYGLGKCCTQTDIYGIGMLIYFMLKGENPSTGIEPLLDEKYEIGIDDDIKKIIQNCVRIDILDRYISVDILKTDILELAEKHRQKKNNTTNVDAFNIINGKSQATVFNGDKIKRNVRKLLYFTVIILLNLM